MKNSLQFTPHTADYNSQFNETIAYLYNLRKHGIKLGLENPRKLMSILGNPHNSFHSIHVAGTNGKGSTSAMIAEILKEGRFRVGLYTSPHLVNFTERIRINGIPISEHDVISLTAYIRNAIANTDINPTFFEFVTAMAFYYFACKQIDWAVVEVGMGGRLDATNVLLPQVSVITNIGLEHTEFLGESIPNIAFEKAGIIKPATPLITAVTQPEALEVIKDKTESFGSEMHLYGRDLRGILTLMNERHIEFNYSGYKNYTNLSLPLTGRHQLLNASIAIRVCEILMQKGYPICEEAIYKGLSCLNFEGRLEWVSKKPPIIIDGAHNPEAAKTLATAIKELFPAKRFILIIGIMNDKDIEGILKPLIDISHTVILTRPKGKRPATPQRLKKHLLSLPQSSMPESLLIKTTTSLVEAIELARILHEEGDIILITGSFYTAGEAKEVLGQKGVLSQLRE